MRAREFLGESAKTKLSKIASDIKSGETPVDVISRLKNFIVNLITKDSTDYVPTTQPTQVVEPVEPVATAPAVQPSAPTQSVAEPTAVPTGQDLVEPAPEEEEPAVAEARAKQAEPSILVNDLEIYELIKRAKPEDADVIWAFYNRQMIESFVHKICDEKDIPKEDDKDRITNLFIKAPGTLEDKVTLVKTIFEKGAVNTKKMLTPSSGSIDKLLSYKSPTLDAIKGKLLSMRVMPSTTSANTGDGEAFFLFLGKGIAKLSPGDLNILGREIEIKAQGARLKGFGGKGVYGDGTTYYSIFNMNLSKIVGGRGITYLKEYIGYDKKTKQAKWDLNKPLHFSLSNLAALSETLAKYAKGKQGAVQEMFDKALQHIYRKSTPEMRELVTNTIESNGSFDPTEFRRGWFMLTYEYYNFTSTDPKSGEGFAAILFIHQPSFTYNIVTSGEQISNNWDKFEIGTNLYSWTDLPSIVPKITYGKETR